MIAHVIHCFSKQHLKGCYSAVLPISMGGTAVAARGQIGSGDEIVGSSLISSDSRMSSFRMWHIFLIFYCY